MADVGSGFYLPSRDTQEHPPDLPSSASPSDQDTGLSAKVSLALSILSEKIKSGALQRSELMDRIVAQASVATSAKGIALALRRESDGLVVCCAATGDMAPPPETILDEHSGFTAECLRNGVLLVCEDAETDDRVDQQACRGLGVRSIVAAPVESDGRTLGVLEALSDKPGAFSKQHIEVLLTLACLAKSAIPIYTPEIQQVRPREFDSIAEAFVTPPLRTEKTDAVQETSFLDKIEDVRIWSQRVPRRVRLGIAAAAAAALLLVLFATALFLWMWRQNASVNAHKAVTPPRQEFTFAKPPAGINSGPPRAGIGKRGRSADAKPLISKASVVEKIPTEKVLIVSSEDGTLANRAEQNLAPPEMVAAASEDTGELSGILASGNHLPVVSLPTSQGVIPARLQHRVEPVYPADAKRLRIEGPVVLRAGIDENGKVQSVHLVKGTAILAQAAMVAVRQWRYHPSELNHRPVASTTDVTIVFHLN